MSAHCSRLEQRRQGVPYFAVHCAILAGRWQPWPDTCPPLPVIVGNCFNAAPISRVFSPPWKRRHRIPLISERLPSRFVPRPCASVEPPLCSFNLRFQSRLCPRENAATMRPESTFSASGVLCPGSTVLRPA